MFGDIPHCLNQRDDILLGGRDKEEHIEVLRTVLQRAKDHGITFNRGKCQFEKEEIELFGHTFTKDGLKPSPDKVRAIKECVIPKIKESRHPPGNDNTEKSFKWTVEAEHAVVIGNIREETQKDETMQKLAKRISKEYWEKYKRDRDIEPYTHVKQELSVAERLIFREQWIVQRKTGKNTRKAATKSSQDR